MNKIGYIGMFVLGIVAALIGGTLYGRMNPDVTAKAYTWVNEGTETKMEPVETAFGHIVMDTDRYRGLGNTRLTFHTQRVLAYDSASARFSHNESSAFSYQDPIAGGPLSVGLADVLKDIPGVTDVQVGSTFGTGDCYSFEVTCSPAFDPEIIRAECLKKATPIILHPPTTFPADWLKKKAEWDKKQAEETTFQQRRSQDNLDYSRSSAHVHD